MHIRPICCKEKTTQSGETAGCFSCKGPVKCIVGRMKLSTLQCFGLFAHLRNLVTAELLVAPRLRSRVAVISPASPNSTFGRRGKTGFPGLTGFKRQVGGLVFQSCKIALIRSGETTHFFGGIGLKPRPFASHAVTATRGRAEALPPSHRAVRARLFTAPRIRRK